MTEKFEENFEIDVASCRCGVKIGSSGYIGGDAGHGGFALIEIENDGATIEVEVNGKNPL
jgi:hypothetical protein